jgi:hypothetical protein
VSSPKIAVKTAERRLYLDSSAWLAMVLGEPDGAAIGRELDGAIWLSSTLLVVECHRNLVRLAREGQLTSRQLVTAVDRLDADLAHFVLMDLTLSLARSRVVPVVTTPRTLDLVHLQTALAFHGVEPLHRFVALDQALNEAARELGLPV